MFDDYFHSKVWKSVVTVCVKRCHVPSAKNQNLQQLGNWRKTHGPYLNSQFKRLHTDHDLHTQFCRSLWPQAGHLQNCRIRSRHLQIQQDPHCFQHVTSDPRDLEIWSDSLNSLDCSVQVGSVSSSPVLLGFVENGTHSEYKIIIYYIYYIYKII